MTKHRWRESVKSFFGSHIDPEKDEQLKGTKMEMEDKVKKILKLIKNEDLEENDGISVENSRKESLAELIEDFHKHYLSLYTQYDHLTRELRKKVHGKREKESSSSSSSDTDSDYSSKDEGSKNGQVESEIQRITDEMKQEIETANLEVAELKRKLTAVSEEKKTLNSEYLTALSKIQEAEEIIGNLKLEAEKSDVEKLKLLVENGELNLKLEIAGKIECELNQRLEDMKREKDYIRVEKKTAMKRVEEGGKNAADLKTMADRLKDENVILAQELGTLREETSNMRQQLESAEQQVSDLSHNLNATEEENKSLSLKVSEISNEILQAQNVIQDFMAESSQSKEKLGERERELSTLLEMHKMHGNESSARIKELEAQVAGLDLDLESLRVHNRETEVHVESKATEAKQLAEQNKELLAQISELEMRTEERRDDLSALKKKFEDVENELLSRIENLTAEINNLQADMDSLCAQKAELEEQLACKSDEASIQVKGLIDQVNVLQQDLGSLHSQKAELEVQLERKSQEISEYLIQIENLKEEIVNKVQDQQRILEEQKGFTENVKDLELEVKSTHSQKSELEEQIRAKIEENSQLREEKVGLQDKIIELKNMSTDRGIEFSALQEKHIHRDNEASAQIAALTVQVNNLQQELDSLQTQKNEVEMQLEREKQESSESLAQMENQKSELMNQIRDQQTMLKEQEAAYNKLSEDYKQVECLFQESKLTLEVTERKMGELAEEFHKSVESKDQIVEDLEQMVEDLKKDLEVKGDEQTDLMNQIRDKQRMLKEQEDAFNKLSEEYNQAEGSFQECKAKLEITERKMEEIAEELSKNIQSKAHVVADLEQMVEDLQRDLEVKGDELATLVENVRTIEVKLCLSNQKLRVTEQLLTEKEESFRKTEAKFQEQQRMLEERIATLSGIIAATHEAYCKMISDISEKVNSTLTGLEIVLQKFEEDYQHYEHSILGTSKELQSAKNWVTETNREKEQLKREVSNLIGQLQDKKEQESLLREKVKKLEVMVIKEEGERVNLTKAVKQLEKKVEVLEAIMKEKDEGILSLGEEKREAIRQLCVWIDYHRDRYDYLKEILSKMVVRGQRPT